MFLQTTTFSHYQMMILLLFWNCNEYVLSLICTVILTVYVHFDQYKYWKLFYDKKARTKRFIY